MPFIGEIAALITAVFWSVTAICFSEGSNRVGPIYVNITRLIFAITFLLITFLFLNIHINLSFHQIMNLSISGIIGLIIGDTYLFKAFKSIGARLSMLIMALVPAMSSLMAFLFLGEHISFWGITGMFITIAGIMLVVLKREEKPAGHYKIKYAGIFFALIGAAGQAVGLIYAKFAFNEGEINSFEATFIRIFSALIILYPMAMMTSRFINPVKIFRNDKRALVFTAIGSFFGPFLGITFSLISISHTQVGIASTIMATVPIIMLPMVHFYYKEKLTWISIFGAFIAVAGISVLSLFR
jgi:drug/metabolite transporter (DMT)-like permease